jgi:hypothetical protein
MGTIRSAQGRTIQANRHRAGISSIETLAASRCTSGRQTGAALKDAPVRRSFHCPWAEPQPAPDHSPRRMVGQSSPCGISAGRQALCRSSAPAWRSRRRCPPGAADPARGSAYREAVRLHAEATKWPDIPNIDDPCRTIDPGFNQAQNHPIRDLPASNRSASHIACVRIPPHPGYSPLDAGCTKASHVLRQGLP